MKPTIKRVGKRTLSVVLALMMIISTLVVGIVSTTAASGDGLAGKRIYFDNSKTNWSNVYYFHLSRTDNYWNGNGYSPNNNDTWIKMNKVEGTDNIYYVDDTTSYNTGRYGFCKDDQRNYGNIWQSAIVFRDNQPDVTDSSNMYVPDTSKTATYNSSTYYQYGDWVAYQSEQPTSPTTPAGGQNVIYLKNSKNWYNVYTHFFGGQQSTSWPGLKMELVKDNIYRIELYSGTTTIIFHNNDGTQTADLKIPTDGRNLYDNNSGEWSVYNPYTKLATPTVESNYSVTVLASKTFTVSNTYADDANVTFQVTMPDGSTKTIANNTEFTYSNTADWPNGDYKVKAVSSNESYTESDEASFTISRGTIQLKGPLAENTYTVTTDDSATLTVSNASDYPATANVKFVLELDGVKYESNENNQIVIPSTATAGLYSLKATSDVDGFVESSAFPVNVKKVDLTSVEVASVDGVTLSVAYTDASGASKTLAEGDNARVPQGNKLTVTATLDDGKELVSVSMGDQSKTSAPFEFTAPSEDTTSTITAEVKDTVYNTYKVAIYKTNDPTHGSQHQVKGEVVYSYKGDNNKRATLTPVADENSIYLNTSYHNDKVLEFYVYEVSIPESVTQFRVSGVTDKFFDVDATKDYYAIFYNANDSKYHTEYYTLNDRYFVVDVVADKSVDTGATVTATGTSKPLNSDSSKTAYMVGTEITLTATPSSITKYKFDRYEMDGATVTSPVTVTPEMAGKTITAYFVENQKYTINLTKGDTYTITSNVATQFVGENVTITVVPTEGNKVTKIVVDGVEYTNIKNPDGTYTYQFNMPANDVTVSAVTEVILPQVTVTNGNGGTLEVAGGVEVSENVYEADFDTTYTFTVTPDDGKVVDSFKVNGVDNELTKVDGELKYTIDVVVNANTTIEVTYKDRGNITLTADKSSLNLAKDETTATLTVAHESDREITNIEYSMLPTTGATIVGNGATATFTATAEGEYVVTATATDVKDGTSYMATTTIKVIDKDDITFYLACMTGWDQYWDKMSITSEASGNAAQGVKYVSDVSIGNKKINGSDRKVFVLTVPGDVADWSKFYIGNNNNWVFANSFQGAPQEGYCYYIYNDGSDHTVAVPATTVSAPKVNGETSFTTFVEDGETINLTATINKSNSSSGNLTAGGTEYKLYYTITDDNDNVVAELPANATSWTPTSAGTYKVKVALKDGYTSFTTSDFATINAVAKTYSNITVAPVENATIKVTDLAGNEITQGYEGQTVKVTVTPENGYKVTAINFGSETAENPAAPYEVTFTMPANAVEVSATVAEKQLVNVDVTSSDATMGTVTVTPATGVYEGDSITIKATPASVDYTFTGWTFTSGVPSTVDKTKAELTFTPNGTNVTAVANFKLDQGIADGHKLIYSLNYDNPTGWLDKNTDGTYKHGGVLEAYYKDNKYTATFDAEMLELIGDKTVRFGFSDDETAQKMFYHSGGDSINVKLAEGTTLSACNKGDFNDQGYSYHFGLFRDEALAENYTSISITLDLDTKTYTVSGVRNTTPVNKVEVYAKNGTVVSGGTQDYGVTIISDTTVKPSSSTGYKMYKLEKGTQFTLQTTLNTKYKDAGAYVIGYVINGTEYAEAQETSVGSGVYEATYFIKDAEDTPKKFEITPVYLNKHIMENGDYITYFVKIPEASRADWQTVATYAYYYNVKSTDGSTTGKLEGAWPGQVMIPMQTPGMYKAYESKYFYDINGTKTDAMVSGLTICNYATEPVHQKVFGVSDADIIQSYDYDNFKQFANHVEGAQIIQFELERSLKADKDSTGDNTHAIHFNSTYKEGVDIPNIAESLPDFIPLRNYYLEEVDIYNNVITDTTVDPEIYIVSVGNMNNSSIGQWSTKWFVYDKDGKYITNGADTEINFIMEKIPELQGKRTFISYEGKTDCPSGKPYSNNNTSSYNRVDGRWTVTTNDGADYDVKVTTQYTDEVLDSYDKYEGWTYDSTGDVAVTKLTEGQGVLQSSDDNTYIYNYRNAIAEGEHFSAQRSNSEYTFIGWYAVDALGNRVKLAETKNNILYTVSQPVEIIGCFVPVKGDTVNITHSMFMDTTLGALLGKGTFGISAVVTEDELGNVPVDGRSYGSIVDESINLPIDPAADYNRFVKITLTTQTAGMNTFNGWWYKNNGSYTMFEPDPDDSSVSVSPENYAGAKGTITHSFVVPIYNWLNAAGNAVTVKSVQYYSDIAPVTQDAILNYHYVDRFGNDKVYTVKVTLDDTYVIDGAYSLKSDKGKELIYANAPGIEDLYKDCVWDIESQYDTVTGTTVNIRGTHKVKTYKVAVYTNGDIVDDIYTIAYNNYLTDNDGNAIVAPESYDGKEFSYWAVYALEDTAQSKIIAKCFTRNFSLKIINNYAIVAVYEGSKIDAEPAIGDAKYTREQYTDGSGTHDYLYADFIVSYMGSNVIKLNSTSKNDKLQYQTGLMVDIQQYAKITPDMISGTKVDYSSVTFESSDTELERIAKSGVKGTYKLGEDKHNVFNFTINNADYNNFNRLNYHVKFDNTTAMQNYVMKAYYYVIITDTETGEQNFVMTDPTYFNLYEIGHTAPGTTIS